MQVMWQRGASTADEIIEALGPDSEWQDATVKTLINRLLKKGAIEATSEGRRYRYRPLLEQGNFVLGESAGLVNRWFDGRVAPLVAHFSEHGKLSKRDIAELRSLIEELDNDR